MDGNNGIEASKFGEADDGKMFESIVKNIRESDRHKRVIYISLGAAANMATIKDERKIVEPMYMHQFPPTLSELENKHPDTTFHIILIDPLMESIPYIITDETGLKQSDEFIRCNEDVELYRHYTGNKTVYVIRKYASYIGNEEEKYCDINPLLRDLIGMSVCENSLFVFNDFSGRSSNELATYYDEIKPVCEHLNHIIIGLNMRTEYGCYIDLTNDMCKFAYFVDSEKIMVFNPYFYLLNDIDIDSCGISDDIDDDDAKIIMTQTQSIFETNKKKIKDGLLCVYRRTNMLTKGASIDFGRYELNQYSTRCGINLQKLYEDKEYVKLNNVIREELIKEFEKIIKLHKINSDGETMFKMVTIDESPYNWVTAFNTFFEMMS
jgi:hypothetical protein